MERRQQVFVSSTYKDLVAERREVMQALLELRCLPAGMELFPATNETQWSLIKRVIDESDYYLVIVGGRYGSLTEKGISYTEQEFDYALETKKHILAFVHSNPGEIASKNIDLEDKSRKALGIFRTKVMTGRTVREFRDSNELGSVVSRSLSNALINHPGQGWVRGEFAMTEEVRTEMAELRERLAEALLDESRSDASLDVALKHYQRGNDDAGLVAHFGSMDEDASNWTDIELNVTWDDVIKFAGPSLFDEITEGDFRASLENALKSWSISEEDPKLTRDSAFFLYLNYWEEVKIQLLALGVIERGTRRRAVSDTNTYYVLTARGRDELVKLSAKRRQTVE